MLEKNFEKINFGKWHAPACAGRRQTSYYSLRGFYLGIVSEALGHTLYKSDGHGSVLVRTSDNQLHKSAIEFNNLDGY